MVGPRLAEWHDANGNPSRPRRGGATRSSGSNGSEWGTASTAFTCRGHPGLRREDWAEPGGNSVSAVQVRNFEHFVYHGSHLLRAAASLAAALRRSSAAAELFGAASTWEDTYGVSNHDRDVPVFDAGIARCRRQLARVRGAPATEPGPLDLRGGDATADHVLEELAEALSTRPAGLTEREVEVLRLVAVGLSNDDIAQRLVISPRTVHTHIRAVFAKLGVSTRTAAAHEASLLNML